MSLPRQTISPLRQRMLEDMTLRKLSDKTQSAYVRAVRGFAGYLRRPPDTASAEDLRRYQLHLVETGVSHSSRVETQLNPFYGPYPGCNRANDYKPAPASQLDRDPLGRSGK